MKNSELKYHKRWWQGDRCRARSKISILKQVVQGS